MTTSKLISQDMARVLLEQHSSAAMEIALEVVRIVHRGGVQKAGSRLTVVMHAAESSRILDAVCAHFDTAEHWLRGHAMQKALGKSRKVAWALLRWRLQWTWQQIGDVFDRDPTTIIAGVGKVSMDSPDIVAICERLDAAEAAE